MFSTEAFYSYLLHQKKYSPNTVDAYKRDIHAFQEYLNNTYSGIAVEQADEFMIRSWLAGLMESGMKPSSIKRKKAALTTFYKYCLKHQILTKIPSRQVITPRPGKRLPVFIPETGIVRLFETNFFDLKEYEDVRNRMMIETLYITGMRVSELVALTDESFDIPNNRMKVLGKRNKERLIPLHRKFSEMIHHYIMLRNKNFEDVLTDHSFFLTNKGKKIYRKFAYRVIISYLSGITSMKKKSPHVMRHTFATHLLNQGADINAIKDILGHTSLAATQFYTHNTIEQLKTVYKKTHPKSQKRRKT